MAQKIYLAFVITRRELADQFHDWRIVAPMVLLSGIFPFLISFAAQQAVGFASQHGGAISPDRLVPFLLLTVGTFPVIIALVIALETFVGEKERGSLETVLFTPVTDWQLYFGKLFTAFIPASLTSLLGMGIYLLHLKTSGITLPAPDVLLQVAAVTSIQALVMISAAVVISMHTTSVRAANLMTAFIVIPIGFLIQGESIVLLWGDLATLRWILFGLIVLALLLTRMGLAHFGREEMVTQEIDSLDLRRSWRIFLRAFTGGSRSPWDWYVHSMSRAVCSLKVPVILVSLLLVYGGWIGLHEVAALSVPIPVTGGRTIASQLGGVLDQWPLFSVQPVIAVWWQNVRVLLLSCILGLFSFGVLGMVPSIFSVGVAGYMMGTVSQIGISPGLYLVGFILPHGLFELAAAILGTAGILKMGAVLASPVHGKPVGEVWLTAMADWVKVMIGLVIPLLFVAAAVEVWITPRLALWLFR